MDWSKEIMDMLNRTQVKPEPTDSIQDSIRKMEAIIKEKERENDGKL